MTTGLENSLITQGRQISGLLQIIDAEKNNPNITLKEILGIFASQYAFNPCENSFAFYNQYQLINSLYGYICIPKEKNFEDLPEVSLIDLNEKWGLKSQNQICKLKDFVRIMRNAISHGHIEVTKDLVFSFKDRENHISFGHIDLSKFCQALAYWCLKRDVTLKGL